MDASELKIICDAVVRLTELRLLECKHLCIENYAPELLAKMVAAARSDLYYAPADPQWKLPE